MLGVPTGRRLFDDGAWMSEKTLVRLGDDCTLNAGVVLQAHSMEDGVVKSDHIAVGSGVSLGAASFVHYGVTIGDGAVLAPDSFVMKGTEVPARARWQGIPAREVAVRHSRGCASGFECRQSAARLDRFENSLVPEAGHCSAGP